MRKKKESKVKMMDWVGVCRGIFEILGQFSKHYRWVGIFTNSVIGMGILPNFP